jgi:starch synthase
VVHVHDHHAGLIPFMMKFGLGFVKLRNIRTVLTIHNGQYQGWMDWDKSHYLPPFDNWKSGMLDWHNRINPLASAVKCADRVTTVSPSYMEELRENANGLEALFEFEKGKCTGILNGIDNEVWDPETDPLITTHYNADTVVEGKQANKEELCASFGLNPSLPLFVFIGRLVGEKAAEILPAVIGESIAMHSRQINFIVLRSGEPAVESQLKELQVLVPGNFGLFIGYNEKLAHQIYAGADFLLMPSRVEPCGLNQMYALRYGTVPMVRNTGGLRDTVKDIGEPDFAGFGLVFNQASPYEVNESIHRAMGWYLERPDILTAARKKMMAIDHSWERSATEYLELYTS